MRRFLKYAILTLGAVACLWLMCFGIFLLGVATVKPQKTDQATDAIIVLTGGQNRISTGLDLLAAGKAQYLFISGVNPNVTIEHLVRLWKPDFDYIPCCIILGLAANNTEGNARESAEWVRAQGVGSVRMVTSNYHLPRAWIEFRHALPGHTLIAHPIKPTSVDYDSKHFLLLSFGEYNKTLATWFRLYVFPWNRWKT